MRNLKILALAAIAIAVLMASGGAGVASATELCSTNTNPCSGTMYGPGTVLHAISEGHMAFQSGFRVIECESTIEAAIANTGSSSETAQITITHLEWTSCGCPYTTVENGELEIHTENASSNGNGTLTGKSSTWTTTCSGVACKFGFSAGGTDLGTLTGGNPATIDIESQVVYKTGDASNFVCTAGTGIEKWQGSYEITSPKPLFVI